MILRKTLFLIATVCLTWNLLWAGTDRETSMNMSPSLEEKSNESLGVAIQESLANQEQRNKSETFRVYVHLAREGVRSQDELKSLYADERGKDQVRTWVQMAQDRVLSIRTEGKFNVLNVFNLIFGFSAECDLEALNDLASRDGVTHLELMPVYKISDTEAHALTGVANAHGAENLDGSGITIAILDDGFDYTHPALAGNWVAGADFGDTDSDPFPDCNGQSHGTNVAGVALGDSPGVRGVAPSAGLVGVKISSPTDCSGSLSGDIAGAIDWVANNAALHSIDILSMSFGGGQNFSVCNGLSMENNALNAVNGAGVIAFAASGNEGYCDSMSWPACNENVISVGAVYDDNVGSSAFCVSSASCNAIFDPACFYCDDSATWADKVTCYSNSASFLDLLAPSNCATTADYPGHGVNPCFSGTSSATPYAAGLAALLLEAGSDALETDDMRALLSITGVPVTDTNKNNEVTPRVNFDAAFEALPPQPGFGGTDPRFVIIIDRSGSMQTPRGSSTRCQDAVAAAIAEVNNQFSLFPTTQVEVLTFTTVWNGSANVPAIVNETGGFVNQTTAINALNNLSGVNCGGLTPLAEASCQAITDLTAAFPNPSVNTRVVSIYSDGFENASNVCSGPWSALSDPPYTAGSWQANIWASMVGNAIVNVRFWSSLSTKRKAGEKEPQYGGDDAPGRLASRAPTLEKFFRDLTYETGGGYVAIGDASPVPPPPAPVPVRPVANCQSVTLNLNASGVATLTAAMVDDGSYDSDGFIASRSISRTTFTCADIGNQAVEFRVTDNDGITAVCYATVKVRDPIPPVLTLNGSATMTLECGDAYAEAGASVSDNCQAGAVLTGGDVVDTGEPGTYVVDYDSFDYSGTPAAQINRTVEVVDTISPYVFCPGDLEVESRFLEPLPSTDPRFAAFLNGASATDICDPNPAINANPPADFPLGDTSVGFTATDQSGNPSHCVATVTLNLPPFAVYAYDGVTVFPHGKIYGNVGVRNDGNGSLWLDNNALIDGDAFADTLTMRPYAAINKVASYNQLYKEPTAMIHEAARSPVAFPIADPSPSIPNLTAGGQDITHNWGTATLSPGSYGRINIMPGKTTVLELEPGTYNIQQLMVNNDASIRFLGPVELIVPGGITIWPHAWFGPAPGVVMDAEEIDVTSGGNITIDNQAQATGYFLAPYGHIRFTPHARGYGQFIGKFVEVNNEAVVTRVP